MGAGHARLFLLEIVGRSIVKEANTIKGKMYLPPLSFFFFWPLRFLHLLLDNY